MSKAAGGAGLEAMSAGGRLMSPQVGRGWGESGLAWQ